MDSKRVMFVDDDPLVCQLTHATLGRLGHSVATFGDAATALEAFREDPGGFDLVVTDLRLGAASGFDLAAAVIATRPGMPVVVTSGQVGADEEARAGAIGVAAILPKPQVLTGLARLLQRIFP